MVKRAPFPRLSQARCASMRCVGSAMAKDALVADSRLLSMQSRFPVLLQSYLLLQLGLANDACIAVTFPCASALCLWPNTQLLSSRQNFSPLSTSPTWVCVRQTRWIKGESRRWEKTRLDPSSRRSRCIRIYELTAGRSDLGRDITCVMIANTHTVAAKY